MSLSERKKSLEELLQAPLEKEGYEIAEIVLSVYKHNHTVRLFVYSRNGVKLDECARVSRIAGDLIDGTDWFERGYTLEVSSPGLDRPLTQARDFRFRTGETVRVEFTDQVRKKLTAEILSATDNDVTLRDKEKTLTVPLTDIKQAKIVF